MFVVGNSISKGLSGLQVDIPDTCTPLEVFDRIIDMEVLELIALETNRYAQTQFIDKINQKSARIHR